MVKSASSGTERGRCCSSLLNWSSSSVSCTLRVCPHLRCHGFARLVLVWQGCVVFGDCLMVVVLVQRALFLGFKRGGQSMARCFLLQCLKLVGWQVNSAFRRGCLRLGLFTSSLWWLFTRVIYLTRRLLILVASIVTIFLAVICLNVVRWTCSSSVAILRLYQIIGLEHELIGSSTCSCATWCRRCAHHLMVSFKLALRCCIFG